MWRKSCLLALATVVIALAAAPAARAGGDDVPETAPAPRYNYAPQQEPIYEAPVVYYYPRPVITFGVYPAFGFYGRPFGYYGGYHRYYRRGGRYWR